MSKWRVLAFICVVCSLVFVSQQPADVQAGNPIKDAFLVASQEANLAHPAVAYNTYAEEYLVVWCQQKAGGVAIYARTISKTGLLGSIYPVSETTSAAERCKPDVAYNSIQHNYLVVWEEMTSGPQFNVHGRLFTPGSLGAEVTFNTNGSSNYVDPAVAYNSTVNEFLVVWSTQPFGGNYSIMAQRLSYDGVTKPGVNFTVALGENLIFNSEPDVAFNPARNEYLVTWTRRQNYSSPSKPSDVDIFGQIVTYDLVKLYVPLGIGYHTIDENHSAVAAIWTPGLGYYLVSWEVLYNNGDHDVWARSVAGDGSFEDVKVVSASYLDERYPAVAGNPRSGYFLVLWNSNYDPPYQANLGTRGRNATLTGGMFPANWAGGITAGLSAVAGGPGDDFLVVWEDWDLSLPAKTGLWARLWSDRTFVPIIKK